MSIFNCHIGSVTLTRSKAELFSQVFLNEIDLINLQLPLILQTIDDQCLGIDGIRTTLNRIIDLEVNLEQIFKLELKGTRTEEIFSELLKEKYSNKIC